MLSRIFATDYDGTLADQGRVAPNTLAAVRRIKESGTKALLVTGRILDDLYSVFPDVGVFDSVVAENGAVLHDPATGEITLLAERPPTRFIEILRKQRFEPFSVGKVMVATTVPHQERVLRAIRELSLELEMILNKESIMILPAGINKVSGMEHALRKLNFTFEETAAIGDAENDIPMIQAAALGVAVGDALPEVKSAADLVMEGGAGKSVEQLVELLISRRA